MVLPPMREAGVWEGASGIVAPLIRQRTRMSGAPAPEPDFCDYAGWWDEMDRVVPKYRRGEVDKAGVRLTKFAAKSGIVRLISPAYRSAQAIVENWRASHSYPLLALRINLENRTKKIDSNAIVAQRLKRFSSIQSKLIREPRMSLSQMQDIGHFVGAETLFLQLTSIQSAASHLSKPMGESSKIVPCLTENWRLHDLYFQRR
jgi:hypothetical protein